MNEYDGKDYTILNRGKKIQPRDLPGYLYCEVRLDNGLTFQFKEARRALRRLQKGLNAVHYDQSHDYLTMISKRWGKLIARDDEDQIRALEEINTHPLVRPWTYVQTALETLSGYESPETEDLARLRYALFAELYESQKIIEQKLSVPTRQEYELQDVAAAGRIARSMFLKGQMPA